MDVKTLSIPDFKMRLMYVAPPTPHLLDININKGKGFPVPSPNSYSPDYIIYHISYICDGSNYFFCSNAPKDLSLCHKP